MNISLKLGALAPPLQEQLAGLLEERELARYERLAVALAAIHVHGFITDKACERARARLAKAILDDVQTFAAAKTAAPSPTTPSPPAPHPMAKEYLKEAARAVDAKLPDNHGFILLSVGVGVENPRACYISSLRREDAINVLKEWLIRASGEEEWMKHIR